MRIVEIAEYLIGAAHLVYFDNPKEVWLIFWDGDKVKFSAADFANAPTPSTKLLDIIKKYLCE